MAASNGLKTARIGILIGSTRRVRVGPSVTQFVENTIATRSADSIETSTVDISKFGLPVFDEAVIPAQVPAQAQFAHEHSKAWNAEIEKYDGYIIVSPEYNFGVPGGLKNAIDYLYHAWTGKPVLVITYGGSGGIHASEALKTILGGMKLNVCETRPTLKFGAEIMPAMGQGVLTDTAREMWKKEYGDVILKGWGELRQAVLESKQN
ncbi:NADPH-dependent FMN reductase [Aspergillus sclerotialis]|uniref:NADPH-dependent FMN reductase n=1 Tax=Aspergillus sclerotialis TaxID=2070753 RepID=A0A3A2ZJN5_9EURO|nr:NADPH-dependent FMN reductase [Aspergillus sclerotialis]